jgi:hypothetical protein
MNSMRYYSGVAAVVALTLIAGLVHGKLTNRWGVPADMKEAAGRFDRIPSEYGDWVLESREEMTETVVTTLECEGYLNGRFVNRVSGARVNAFIVLGPPGPISVHTPEVCYNSQGKDIREERVRVPIKDSHSDLDNEFWMVTMRSRDVNAEWLRVYYAWGNKDRWTAPESPRVSFGGQSLLFKFQLAINLPPDADASETDTCQQFLKAFMPVVNPILFTEDDQGKQGDTKAAEGAAEKPAES